MQSHLYSHDTKASTQQCSTTAIHKDARGIYLLKKKGVQGSSRTAGLLRSELKVVGRRAGKIFILSVLLKYQQVQLMQGIFFKH